MLKKLIKKNMININDLLFLNYHELQLTEVELVVLMHLFKMINQKQTLLSLNALTRKCSFDIQVCGEIINSLMKKGFLSIDIEYGKDLKGKEIFNLDKTLEKLELLYFEEHKEELKKQENSQLQTIIKLVEAELGRLLSSSEMDTIIIWSEDDFSIDDIHKALMTARRNNKMSVKYIDSLLVANKKHISAENEMVIDEKIRKSIDDFYNSIK